jgi:hypothetical protein
MSNHYNDKTCNPALATSAGATTVLATSADATTPVVLATSADATTPVVPHSTSESLGVAFCRARKAKKAYAKSAFGSDERRERRQELLAAEEERREAEEAFEKEQWEQEQWEQEQWEQEQEELEAEEAAEAEAEEIAEKVAWHATEFIRQLQCVEGYEAAGRTLVKLYRDAWTIRAPEGHPIWEEIEEWKAVQDEYVEMLSDDPRVKAEVDEALAKWRRQPPVRPPRGIPRQPPQVAPRRPPRGIPRQPPQVAPRRPPRRHEL